MKLADGERHTHLVDVGLVDSRGAFLLLLDDDETAYYRFSDESNLIEQLMHDAEFYKKRALELEGELFKAEVKRDEWHMRSERYRRDCNELKKRKRTCCPKCGEKVTI